MIKKIALITLSSLLLGGCTLGNYLKPNEAATDAKNIPVATATPVPTSDQSLDSVPATSSETDDTSLETDLNNTAILDEDFSDLN